MACWEHWEDVKYGSGHQGGSRVEISICVLKQWEHGPMGWEPDRLTIKELGGFFGKPLKDWESWVQPFVQKLPFNCASVFGIKQQTGYCPNLSVIPLLPGTTHVGPFSGEGVVVLDRTDDLCLALTWGWWTNCDVLWTASEASYKHRFVGRFTEKNTHTHAKPALGGYEEQESCF